MAEFRIKEIHAITAIGDDDEEGIPAFMSSEGPIPMVASDHVRLDQLREMAQIVANQTGRTLQVSRFSVREDLEKIEPRPVERALITLAADGTVSRKTLTEGPELDVLRAIVGGPIELIPLLNRYEGAPCVAFCNEEGKLPPNNLPFNANAHRVWEQNVGRRIVEDRLVGNIAVITGPPSFLATL